MLPDPQNIPTKMVNTRKTMENHQIPPKPKAKATKIALLGFFADIQKFSCLCA